MNHLPIDEDDAKIPVDGQVLLDICARVLFQVAPQGILVLNEPYSQTTGRSDGSLRHQRKEEVLQNAGCGVGTIVETGFGVWYSKKLKKAGLLDLVSHESVVVSWKDLLSQGLEHIAVVRARITDAACATDGLPGRIGVVLPIGRNPETVC
jgi:hypothetical protein